MNNMKKHMELSYIIGKALEMDKFYASTKQNKQKSRKQPKKGNNPA